MSALATGYELSDFNGGWRYGLTAPGDLHPWEWSRPFATREDAERHAREALGLALVVEPVPEQAPSTACECGKKLTPKDHRAGACFDCGLPVEPSDWIAIAAREIWDRHFAGSPGFPESDFPRFLELHRETVARFQRLTWECEMDAGIFDREVRP